MDIRGFFHGESMLHACMARLMTIAIEGPLLEDVNFSEILDILKKITVRRIRDFYYIIRFMNCQGGGSQGAPTSVRNPGG